MAAAAASTLFAGVLLCAAAAAAFFTTAHAKTDDGDLVAKSCANATRNWPQWFYGDFCESTLRLDKRSAAAKHPRDLALISMDLAQRAVADADAKVDGMLRSGAGRLDNNTTLILQHCRLDYAAVTITIPVCRAMVDDYKKPNAANQLAPNDYFECSRQLWRNTSKCYHRVFDDTELWKLLFKEVSEAWVRPFLVEAMLEEMLGVLSGDDGFCTSTTC